MKIAMPSPAELVVADLAPTGVLRASINLGNPVLAAGPADAPTGVTVDIAREIAARLDVPVQFVCFDAARKSFEALRAGEVDLGFLAVEPARAADVVFTAPYAIIEAVFVVPDGSDIATLADVDRPGVRIGVKEGSAYDLFLTRTLQRAEVVRGPEGIDVFREHGLEAGAGIRQPVLDAMTRHVGLRVIDERFMEIRQALAISRSRADASGDFLADCVENLKATGFVADALRRAGRTDASVAPLAVRP